MQSVGPPNPQQIYRDDFNINGLIKSVRYSLLHNLILSSIKICFEFYKCIQHALFKSYFKSDSTLKGYPKQHNKYILRINISELFTNS